LNSLPSLSSQVQPTPRRIDLPGGPRCTAFALTCAIYFTSCQRTDGPEPLLGTVGSGLGALFLGVLLGGAIFYWIRRRISERTALGKARARVGPVVDSSSVDREAVAWRYLRKQKLDGGGPCRGNP
jgi:hypothetical protein